MLIGRKKSFEKDIYPNLFSTFALSKGKNKKHLEFKQNEE